MGPRCRAWNIAAGSPLPESIELFNLATDASESTNVASQHPDVVAGLQARINELASVMSPPLILQTEFNAMRARLALPPALPQDEYNLTESH